MGAKRWVLCAIVAVMMLTSACGGPAEAPDIAIDPPEPTLSAVPTTQSVFRIGETATLYDGQRVTVEELEYPVKAVKNPDQLDPGASVLGAKVHWCAGPNPEGGAVGSTGLNWGLILADDTQGQIYLGEKDPAFINRTLRANQCNRGWITFLVQQGQEPSAVEYQGYIWEVP